MDQEMNNRLQWQRWFDGIPVLKGGPGSGHHGHTGTPGRGGSPKGNSAGMALEQAYGLYTEDAPINTQLRSGTSLSDMEPSIRDAVVAMDKGMAPLSSDVTVYRAVKGIGTKEGRERVYGNANIKRGEEFTDLGYASTTDSFRVAWAHGGGRDVPTTYWRIKLPKGTQALDLRGKGEWGAEREILLPRGTRFRYLGGEYDEVRDMVFTAIEVIG